MKKQTQEVAAMMVKEGMIQLTFTEYKAKIESFGLHIDLSDHRVLTYTAKENDVPYLRCTGGVLDKNGDCWANEASVWYRENIKKRTQKADDFLEFRINYFCILPTGHIYND